MRCIFKIFEKQNHGLPLVCIEYAIVDSSHAFQMFIVFVYFFLKTVMSGLNIKWISWFLESPDLIFFKKYFPLRQVLIYKILQGCLGILPWHCETQNLMSANKWKVIAVSIMFYQSFLCPVLCSPSVSFWVANSSLRPLHNLTAL